MNHDVQPPTEDNKEGIEQWEDQSCNGWYDGWCFTDFTLIPLVTYFSYKCGYLSNAKYESICAFLINLSNLCIIDFLYGHSGSTHDSTEWGNLQESEYG
ncbi:hypothetical protein F5877DRAFT_51905 [Lentinula edodes]|nr:hypothetical protein F5877DRAFT_51905 [Lentinula edodes]